MKSISEIMNRWITHLRSIKYRIQLPAYEIDRCEKRYEEMAASGWMLDKRGRTFERYKRSAPQRRQYRIEFCPVKPLWIEEMTEDQIDFYEDCGWRLECFLNGVYVFSAEADDEPTEIYTDAKEQIRMLKSVKNYVNVFGLAWLCAFLGASLAQLVIGRPSIYTWEAFYSLDWIFLPLLACLIYTIWKFIYGRYRCGQLVKRARKGLPLRFPKEQRPSRYVSRAIREGLLALIALAVVICAVAGIRVRKSDLPEAGSEVPYLLAQEFFAGERKDVNLFGQQVDNEVLYVPALLADYYEVSEYVEGSGGGMDYCHLDQKCYVLRGDGGGAIALAQSLIRHSIFGTAKDFSEIARDGFDYVARGPFTLVAVRGRYVIRVTYLPLMGDDAPWEEILDLLEMRWQD